MKVISTQFLNGPNVIHRHSMLMLVCDLEELARPAGFALHPCNGKLSGQEAVTLRILQDFWLEATQAHSTFADALLHVALALQQNLNVRSRGYGVVLDTSGSVVRIAMQCEIPAVGVAAWEMAASSAALCFGVDLDPELPAGLCRDVASRYANFLNHAHAMSFDQLTIALLRAADQRDIPWFRIAYPQRYVQLGQGKFGRRLIETMIDTTSYFAVKLSGNKVSTHQLLQRLAFPQPVQRLVNNAEQAVHAAAAIGYPVVVKPGHGGKGRGVSVGLATPEQVRQAYLVASQDMNYVVIESLVAGDDYRLLVVGGKLIAGARRLPAFVVGDGSSTIAELIDELNRDPRRGIHFQKVMEIVEIDQETTEVLARQGLTASSVLRQRQRVQVRRTANIARGGTAEDVTDIMHPDNVVLAEDAARVMGLDVAGIDYLTEDIRRSWRDVGGGIIEVNGNPGLRPHWIDNQTQRDVVGPILDLLLPRLTPVRIPTVAVTGSIGKTTTCRMVAHIVAATGRRVGLSVTQGVWIGSRQLRAGDFSGGITASNLMLHPDVEAGVFEMARGGLIRNGMGVDRFDVGAVLNVLDNHLGLDGIHTREELARVKRIIAENSGELVVLNADDPLCLAMREHVRSRRLCLFSMEHNHPELVTHRTSGGCTVSLVGQGPQARIVLDEGEAVLGEMDIRDIPATLGGVAMGKAINAAFAIALVNGLGISFAATASALGSFASTAETNPGRLNLFRGLPYTILLDSLDGPQAGAELVEVVQTLPVSGRRLLLLDAVGNRPDDFIIETAAAFAGRFDRYICSNLTDLRGRAANQVPGLLRAGLMRNGVPAEKIFSIEDIGHALDDAMAACGKDDLLVIAVHSTELALQRIMARQA